MANIGFKNKMIGKVKMNFIIKNDCCLAPIAESKILPIKNSFGSQIRQNNPNGNSLNQEKHKAPKA
jgi:hypothetical protein